MELTDYAQVSLFFVLIYSILGSFAARIVFEEYQVKNPRQYVILGSLIGLVWPLMLFGAFCFLVALCIWYIFKVILENKTYPDYIKEKQMTGKFE